MHQIVTKEIQEQAWVGGKVNPLGIMQATQSLAMVCIIPNTLKMVIDTSLLNTQQYKVRIKGKVEQPKERGSALPYTLVQ